MSRPVDFCGILHGQDHRDSAQAGVCRFDMTLQDVLGGDAVIIKETIGDFSMLPVPPSSRAAVGCCPKA